MDALSSVETYSNAITALGTALAALAAVTSIILTVVLVRENRLLRKAGTEPQVVAHLIGDTRYTNCINFVIANIGQGPARHVTFRIIADQTEWGAHEVHLRNSDTRKPIGVLPQGERIVAFLGLGHKLLRSLV